MGRSLAFEQCKVHVRFKRPTVYIFLGNFVSNYVLHLTHGCWTENEAEYWCRFDGPNTCCWDWQYLQSRCVSNMSFIHSYLSLVLFGSSAVSYASVITALIETCLIHYVTASLMIRFKFPHCRNIVCGRTSSRPTSKYRASGQV